MKRSRRKWLVVGSVATIASVIGGAGAAVIGPVFDPLMKDLGWSNGLTSSMATAYTVGGLVIIPAVGAALDKIGARAVMTFGALAFSAGLCLADQGRSWTTMLVAFVLVGMGVTAAGYLPSAVIVTNWMATRRNLAMGIVMGALSAGAALFSPLIAWWTEKYGWRWTVCCIAALSALMVPLIWLAVQTRPETNPQVKADAVNSAPARVARGDLLSRDFFFAVASCVLFSIGMLGVLFHVVPILVAAGYSEHAAGMAFGATWVLSGVGSLVLGVSADQFDTKMVLAGALLCVAIGALLLLGAGEKDIGIACMVTFILLWGASANCFNQLVPVILVERFGSEKLGTLLGVQFGIGGIAGAIAPVVTGLLYDKFGDYRVAIEVSASATLLSACLILLVNRPKHRDAAFKTREKCLP